MPKPFTLQAIIKYEPDTETGNHWVTFYYKDQLVWTYPFKEFEAARNFMAQSNITVLLGMACIEHGRMLEQQSKST